jgi:hypothetical protein
MIKIHIHFPSINIKLYVKYLSPKVIKRVWAMKKYMKIKDAMPKSMSQKKRERNNGHKDAHLSENNGYKDTR